MTFTKKPIVGISASIITDSGGIFPGYHRCYVNEDYVTSIVKAGGSALILPMVLDETVIETYVNSIDALILTGGHDVTPLNYGEEPLAKLGEVLPRRDRFDLMLLEKAKKRRIPILGICRGHQLLNVYHGGSLWQDLSYVDNVIIKHSQMQSPELTTHSVILKKDSKLYQIFNKREILVNSFHHQVIKNLAPEFKVVAAAKDGAIEGIEHQTYPFMVGVQWHPEMLHQSDKDMNKLFEAFISQAKEAQYIK